MNLRKMFGTNIKYIKIIFYLKKENYDRNGDSE